MSAAEPQEAGGVGILRVAMQVVELITRRLQAPELERLAASQGLALPVLGRVAMADRRLTLSVRPGRWLLLEPDSVSPQVPGVGVAHWQARCAASGAAIDLSAGLAAFALAGAHAREALARGCRLDLDHEVFPPGYAAATLITQVSVILAALPFGMLLLTPASTSRHFHEWLARAAAPFGVSAGLRFEELLSAGRSQTPGERAV